MDRVAAWSQTNERILAPTTARIVLIALNQVCRFAVRRGWLADNPVAKLEPRETTLDTKRAGILEGDQLARFLTASGARRPLFEFLAYTGLRIGEALGLTWADVDYDEALIRVHRPAHPPPRARAAQDARRQARGRARPPDRQAAARALASSPFKAPHHLVWCNTLGRGLDYRDVGEDFRATLKRVDISAPGERLSLHSLRHSFASLLIANGLNVVYVSRQLGHANANVTLEVYAHLFQRADHAATARAALDASYATIKHGQRLARQPVPRRTDPGSGTTVRSRFANVELPEPWFLYFAWKVSAVFAGSPVSTMVALARTWLLPATSSAFASPGTGCVGLPPVTATLIKAVLLPVPPKAAAVTITSAAVAPPGRPDAYVTVGPTVVRLP
jgi:integrase